MKNDAFSIKNPNKVRSLIGAYSMNPVAFHSADGSGYELLGEVVKQLDEINPQISARIVQPLGDWKIYAPSMRIK